MRYTTIIDLSEFRELYANKHLVLLYFHLCLKCGYHADDRDTIKISLRFLAREVNITYSAARYALDLLQRHHLVERMDDGKLRICKYVTPADIPQRPKRAPSPSDERYREKMEEYARQQEKFLRQKEDREAGRTGINARIKYLEEEASHGDERAKKELASIRRQAH